MSTNATRGRKPNRNNTKSVYVPSNQAPNDGGISFEDLKGRDINVKEYKLKQLGNVATLCQFDTNSVYHSIDSDRVQGIALSGSYLYFWFRDIRRVFHLKKSQADKYEYSGSWAPMIKSEELYICKLMADENGIVIFGYTQNEFEGARTYLLTKFDYSGNLLVKSRPYNNEKFSDFSLNAKGELIMLVPDVKEEQSDESRAGGDAATGSAYGQIFKLTPDFLHKVFYFNLTHAEARYIPGYVQADGPAKRSWATIKKVMNGDDPNDDSKASYRLLSFTSSSKFLDDKDSRPKFESTEEKGNRMAEEIGKESWNIAGLSPGPLAKMGDKLLVIDQQKRNLVQVSWNNTESCPIKKTLSEAGKPEFKFICSDGENNAYLVASNGVVMHFSYNKLDVILEDED